MECQTSIEFKNPQISKFDDYMIQFMQDVMVRMVKEQKYLPLIFIAQNDEPDFMKVQIIYISMTSEDLGDYLSDSFDEEE